MFEIYSPIIIEMANPLIQNRHWLIVCFSLAVSDVVCI
jgi:hypothetical protein